MPFWESPVFWGIVSIIGVCLGIYASAYFSNRKVLEYSIHPSALITEDLSNIPGLTVMMYGQAIQDLTATEVTFSNAGNQTLEPSDFAKTEPLGVSVSGICFGVQLKSDNPNSAPIVNPVDVHIFDVEFDFLRPKESLTLILWHDGDASIRGDLKSGKIRAKSKKLDISVLSGALLLGFFEFIIFVPMTFFLADLRNESIFTLNDFLFSKAALLALDLSVLVVVIPLVIFVLIDWIKDLINR